MTLNSNTRFDHDWRSYVTVTHTTPAGGELNTPPSHEYRLGTFQGLWDGTLFVSQTDKFPFLLPFA
jgi:hypothetical protein